MNGYVIPYGIRTENGNKSTLFWMHSQARDETKLFNTVFMKVDSDSMVSKD